MTSGIAASIWQEACGWCGRWVFHSYQSQIRNVMDKRATKAEVHQNAEEELSLSRPMPDSSWKKNMRVSHVARMAKTVWILVAGTDQRINVSYTLCKGWFWEFSANRNFSHLHAYSDPFEIYFLGWTSFAAVSGQGLTLSPSHPYAGKDGKVNRTIHCRCIFNAFASLAFGSGGTLYRVVLLLAFLYPSVLATWFDIAWQILSSFTSTSLPTEGLSAILDANAMNVNLALKFLKWWQKGTNSFRTGIPDFPRHQGLMKMDGWRVR